MKFANVSNEHVVDYLRYYVGLPQAPRYAVMVSGPWGCGKTHLINDFLSELSPVSSGTRTRLNHLYVSLYGVSNRTEIDEAILRALYPILETKGAKVARKFGQGVMKFLRVDVPISAWDVLDKFSPKVYVFDDLERALMAPEICLGFINEFVEHEGCKVIIACNQSEIRDKASYERTLEKVVGKILEVTPNVSSALASFIREIGEPRFSAILEKCADDVALLYASSELSNLRFLKQSLHDCARLFLLFDDSYFNHVEFIRRIMLEFVALSLEVKSGRICEDDLLRREEMVREYKLDVSGTQEIPKLQIAAERYAAIDLQRTLLSENFLANILFRGSTPWEAFEHEKSQFGTFTEYASTPLG